MNDFKERCLRHNAEICSECDKGKHEKKCKTCGYWGGSDSKGDVRICYSVDIYSKEPPDKTHKDYCCPRQN